MTSRLDDTSRCPQADRCEVCRVGHGLAVVTAETVVGVLCVTLCGPCVAAGRLPPVRSVPVAVERVLDHHLHTGTTADS